MEILIVLAKIGSVLVLVFLNGFFVAAEFAIVKVRSTQIEPLAKAGSRKARMAQTVIQHMDAYLSATQLGITLTSLGLGWLGEPVVGDMIEPLFALMGIVQPAVITTVSFIVAFSIITFLHIVLGELAPKSLAIQRPQTISLIVSSPLHIFFVIFKPFIWILNESANYFLRAVGVNPVSESELAHSEEELRLLLSRGESISSTGKSILLKAMELRQRTVREVMVPRTEVAFLSTDRSIEENLKIVHESNFTRYPLCDRELDNVLGMIHAKDFFNFTKVSGSGSQLLDIKRELFFVPETTSLEKLLNLFLSKRVLMAIAVDEFGGTAGLVTLENVLEELVGEIRDEFDVEPLMVHKVSDTEFLINGAMPLHDFARMFAVTPDSKEMVSVGGYALQLFGYLPEQGAKIDIGQWEGTVETIEGKKINLLRIEKLEGK